MLNRGLWGARGGGIFKCSVCNERKQAIKYTHSVKSRARWFCCVLLHGKSRDLKKKRSVQKMNVLLFSINFICDVVRSKSACKVPVTSSELKSQPKNFRPSVRLRKILENSCRGVPVVQVLTKLTLTRVTC
jgi:hypothetical protein